MTEARDIEKEAAKLAFILYIGTSTDWIGEQPYLLEDIHGQAFENGAAGIELSNQTLAQTLNWVVANFSKDSFILAGVLNQISLALIKDDTPVALQLKSFKTGKRNSHGHTVEHIKRSKMIANFVWSRVRDGGRIKPVIGLATVEFGISSSTIYSDIKRLALANARMKKFLLTFSDKPPAYEQDSSDFEKWLEGFAVPDKENDA